jgi:acetyl-CoA synthetase
MLVLVYITTMADIPEPIPIHPVAPRLKEGHKKPHVGPHIGAYKATHAETIGHESDKWWAKVCLYWLEYVRMNLILCR